MDIFLESDLWSDDDCYQYVLNLLHPAGIRCPAGHKLEQLDKHIYKTDLKGVPRYKCFVHGCKKTFNLYTGTFLQGKSYNPREVVDCINGIQANMSCEQLSKELCIEKRRLKKTYHHFKELAELSIKQSKGYKDWENTFKKVLAAGENSLPRRDYNELKRQMENVINSRSNKVDWISVLKKVTHWEIAEGIKKLPQQEGEALYITTDKGERYILQRHNYELSHGTTTKRTVTDIRVEKIRKK